MTINQTTLNRREFLASMLAAGFALAVRPVCADTLVHTDNAGVVADLVRIPAQGGMLPAYMAHPDQGSQWPVVLVVQEIFGVHEHIRDVCRRFAKLGYLAIAPELFFRQGDVSGMSDINEIITQVVSKVPDAQVMSDLDATLQWVKASSHGDISHAAITGFCWGGRITWLYAAHNPNLRAAVAWYGKLTGPKSELQPIHPHDIASQLRVPVLGLYGGKDQGIALESVDKMNSLLAESDSRSQIHVYTDAPHAFFADYRPSYRKDSAEDGWQRAQQWFGANGLIR